MTKELPKVVTALLWKDGRVLSVSRKDDPTILGLPGGKVEPGESLEEALVRELHEETGLLALSWEFVFQAISSSGEFNSHTFYVAEWSGEIHSDEDGVVTWVDPKVLIVPAQRFAPYNSALFAELGIFLPN